MFGGQALTSLANSPAFAFQNFDFVVQATAATQELRFTFVNQLGFWNIDAMLVTQVAAVPEPATLACSASVSPDLA